jgi:hypothetical protein
MFIKLRKRIEIEEKTIISFSSNHMMMEYVDYKNKKSEVLFLI